jgi:hypothetical protein
MKKLTLTSKADNLPDSSWCSLQTAVSEIYLFVMTVSQWEKEILLIEFGSAGKWNMNLFTNNVLHQTFHTFDFCQFM